jgi:hypothetical protein
MKSYTQPWIRQLVQGGRQNEKRRASKVRRFSSVF